MPQIDQIDTFLSQIFWLFVAFGIIYFFVSRSVAPNLSKVIENRENAIKSDLNSAESLKDTAVKANSELDKKYFNAKGEAFTVISAASKDATKFYDKGIADAEAELKKHIELAEKEINLAKGNAVIELNKNIPAYVEEIVGKVSGLKADKQAVEKLIKKVA
jgi:F-type H+-transporting ATPase subunit b